MPYIFGGPSLVAAEQFQDQPHVPVQVGVAARPSERGRDVRCPRDLRRRDGEAIQKVITVTLKQFPFDIAG